MARLPERVALPQSRVRGIRGIPGPNDLERVPLRGDPGVQIPKTGAQHLGKALQGVGTGVAESVQAAMDRQQRRQDVVNDAEATLTFQRESAQAFQKFQVEDNPADVDALRRLQQAEEKRVGNVLSQYKGKLSPDAAATLEANLKKQAAATIAAAGRVHLDAQQRQALTLMEEETDVLVRQVESSPEHLDTLMYQGAQTLQKYAPVLTPEQEAEVRANMEGRLIRNGILGWTRSNADPLTVVRKLETGDLPPTIKSFWGTLDPEERQTLRDQVIKQASETIRLENQLEDRRKEEFRRAINEVAVEFFTTDDPERRLELGERLLEVETDPERVRRYKDFMQDAGVFGEDDAAVVLTLESRIRNGQLRGPLDVLDYLGNGVSADTMRTEILPLMEAMQDKNFRRASDWLAKRLGVPDHGLIGDAEVAAARRVREAQAQLLEFRQQHPHGDFWEAAKTIASRTLEERKSEADARIPILRREYAIAVRNGDYDQADRIAGAIEAMGGNLEGLPDIPPEDERSPWWWPF